MAQQDHYQPSMSCLESSKEDSVAVGSQTTPSFLDTFALHLASRLLGPDHVLRRFDHALQTTMPERGSFRLYWRTELLVDTDPLSMLPSCCTSITTRDNVTMNQENPQYKTVFMDFTFGFGIKHASAADGSDGEQIVNRGHPYVTVSPGASLLLPSTQTGVYAKGSPITMSELRQHAEKISIDVDSTSPEAMANSMAAALFAFQSDKESNGTAPQVRFHVGDLREDENGSMPIEVSIPLCYKDLDETGEIKIAATSSSKLDASAMAMLIANVIEPKQENSSSMNGVVGDVYKEKSLALDQAFEKWWSKSSAPEKVPVIERSNDASTRGALGGKTVSKQSSDPIPLHKDGEGGDVSLDKAPTVEPTVSCVSKHDTRTQTSATIVKSESKGGRDPPEIAVPVAAQTKDPVRTRPGVIVARAAKSKRRKRGKVTYTKA